MSAQSVRLNATASNLANAENVSGDPAQVYKAKQPLFSAIRQQLGTDTVPGGVQVLGITESTAEPQKHFQPGHPQADPQGYVYSPDINAIEEMVNMISASRAYQNSIEVMNTSKQLLLRTLELGR